MSGGDNLIHTLHDEMAKNNMIPKSLKYKKGTLKIYKNGLHISELLC